MDHINSEVIYYSRSTTTKGGTKITLQLPDEEIGQLLDAVGAGKRYMMALVPLTDDDQPDVVPEKPKRRLADMPLSQQAGILCNDERFWDFANVISEAEAAKYIRAECAVSSRADLNRDPIAADYFERIKTDFDAFTGRIAAP